MVRFCIGKMGGGRIVRYLMQQKQKGVTVENETATYIMAMQKINDALLLGLETSVKTMKSWSEYSPERREIIIKSIEELIGQSRKMLDITPTGEGS